MKPEASIALVMSVVAKVSEWLGVLWVAYCAGNVLLAFAVAQRVSDAVSDAGPLVLAAGFGFALAWSIASVAGREGERSNVS